MTQSGIWKIENGSPRRRITLDEAVVIARLFGCSIDALLTPIEVIDREEAKDILAALSRALDALTGAAESVLSASTDYLRISGAVPAAGSGRGASAGADVPALPAAQPASIDGRAAGLADVSSVNELLRRFCADLFDAALSQARSDCHVRADGESISEH